MLTFTLQNSDSMDAMKDAACSNIDDHSEALSELSHDIWSHPEIFYQEKHAHDVLTSFLETRGFTVDKHFVLVCNVSLEIHCVTFSHSTYTRIEGGGKICKKKKKNYGKIICVR